MTWAGGLADAAMVRGAGQLRHGGGKLEGALGGTWVYSIYCVDVVLEGLEVV